MPIPAQPSRRKLRRLMIFALLSAPWLGFAQEAWVAGASIGESAAADFVVGECVMEYTPELAAGFLPALNYSYLSSERQLFDTAAVQVHFDNALQRATVFISPEMLPYRPQYYVFGINGILHLNGLIAGTPCCIDYSRLPHGAYILRIAGVPGRIPFVTRWIKK